jgi:hypothetical protein
MEESIEAGAIRAFSCHDLYRAAMVELDPAQLMRSVESARAAIQRRRERLRGSDSSSMEERQAMADALENLRRLQKIEFRLSTKSKSQSADTANREATL